MPKFNYMARDNSGSSIGGEVVAQSESDAARLLRAEGKFVVRLTELGTGPSAAVEMPTLRGSRVKPDEVIFFCNQLAGMVDTGVPIADALEATIDESPPGAYRKTIEDVIHRVQGGSEFSAALAAHPKVFSPLMINMVRASETTGTLGTMLARLADYMIDQRDLKKRIKGALTYPICMLFFAIGATVFLLTYVLPKFASIYAGKDALLPLPTRILMNTSGWMIANWPYLVAGLLLTVIALIFAGRTPKGKYVADWFRLNIPFIGGMFRKACIARALRTLGAMLSAGVSVLEAILITRDVVGNQLFNGIFESAHQRLEQGEQFCDAMEGSAYFSRPIRQMLRAGERSGQLGPTMDRVADICESDLRHTIRTVTQFIEPAMIVVMGIIIGGIALAMLLPIFQISRVMTH